MSPTSSTATQTDGTFADVSVQAGIADPEGKGLGVVAWDYDRDGDQDLFVANDGMANYLYRNEGDGTFADAALQAGMAFNGEGRAEACMGVDLGDYDNDGDLDLFTTNFSHETNTLYASAGERFRDVTAAAGLSEPSWRVLGFGTGFFGLRQRRRPRPVRRQRPYPRADSPVPARGRIRPARPALRQPGRRPSPTSRTRREPGSRPGRSAAGPPSATTTTTATSTSSSPTAEDRPHCCATRGATGATGR